MIYVLLSLFVPMSLCLSHPQPIYPLLSLSLSICHIFFNTYTLFIDLFFSCTLNDQRGAYPTKSLCPNFQSLAYYLVFFPPTPPTHHPRRLPWTTSPDDHKVIRLNKDQLNTTCLLGRTLCTHIRYRMEHQGSLLPFYRSYSTHHKLQ